MDGIKHGQRLLMAISPSSQDTSNALEVNTSSILIALSGILSLIFLLLICACKNGEKKEEDISLEEGGQAVEPPLLEETEAKVKPTNDAAMNWTNGGPKSPNTGHSRQASAGSVNMRPQSLRELPEPPVSNHARNASMSGVEASNSSNKNNVLMDGPEYAYPQHVPPFKNNPNSRGSAGVDSGGGASNENKVKSYSEGYDHLRLKLSSRPTDYDTFADPSGTDNIETPVSETGSARDGHYSRLREELYAVVSDVGSNNKQLSLSNFMSTPSSNSVDHYSLVKDEDPYNLILESGGTVSPAAARLIKNNASEMDDPYATCQDSGGEFKSLMEEIGAMSGMSMTQPSLTDYGDLNDEYAMVDKSGRVHNDVRERQYAPSRDDVEEESVRPPEPPRMYNDDEDTFQMITPSGHRKEHKYSKVTARESLASMTERNALNPYEIVSDLPENTYATVEGGSGDGVVLRKNTMVGTNPEQRLSQISDTYAEIGISGGGLSTSVISNSSSVGGINNNSSSVSSGAPVPPSVDSLHLMTKSQTSSEGDRLSDRHLATPEDTGLNLAGDDDDTGEDDEDGYSTLRRSDGFSPRNSALQGNQAASHSKEESADVALSLNYQRARGSVSDRETDNDPNYESVDETRAKVAALRARESNGAGMKKADFKLSSLGNNTTSKDPAKTHRRRLDHDYEEVDITPPSSPLTSQRITVTASYASTHISSVPTSTANSRASTAEPPSLLEEQSSMYESHMYEELAEVRAKKSDMGKGKKAAGHGKQNQEEKKKGGGADKKKGASLDKRKNEAEEKKRDKNEEKRKSGSDDKKKEDKRKSEEKKKHVLDEKHNNVIGHNNGTKL